VLGEQITTRDGKTLNAVTQSYLPELRGPVMVPSDADSGFELTTQFTPFQLLQ
jgi:hypothetical protein